MGSGDKFSVYFVRGFGLAVYVDRFPHAVSITLLVGCFNVYLGFGKGYDE